LHRKTKIAKGRLEKKVEPGVATREGACKVGGKKKRENRSPEGEKKENRSGEKEPDGKRASE